MDLSWLEKGLVVLRSVQRDQNLKKFCFVVSDFEDSFYRMSETKELEVLCKFFARVVFYLHETKRRKRKVQKKYKSNT